MSIVADSNFEGNSLTINLVGKIDSTNASDVEQDIFKIKETKPDADVVLDIAELEYISSAGLRVIMKLIKQCKTFKIINASSAVYDIFEMTGFTEIANVSKALRTIDITDCELIGQGGHGKVYRIDSDSIIKVYQKQESLDAIKKEITYSKKAFLYGIPTAISYDLVRCGDSYGTVFELLNSESLGDSIAKDLEHFDDYADKLCTLAKTLHSSVDEEGVFPTAKSIYNFYIDGLTNWLEPDELALLHKLVNSIPDRKTMIHGDLHTKNILIQNGELLLIDLADVSTGHPIFELLGMYLTYKGTAGSGEEFVKQLMGLDIETSAKLLDAFFSRYFNTTDADEIQKITDICQSYSRLKRAIVPALSPLTPENICKLLMADVRYNLLPNIDKIIEDLKYIDEKLG